MHPIRQFIEINLETTTNKFAKENDITQSTISAWYMRSKKIDTIPVFFIKLLADKTNDTMDNVYKCLIKYEKEINDVTN